MPDEHRQEIKGLVRRLDVLSEALERHASQKELGELIQILRKPGWTTPAEIIFFRGIVDTLISQTKLLGVLQSALLRGSRAVGREGR